MEADEADEESENQPDLFFPVFVEAELDDAVDSLGAASLCRCCSRIWSSPIAK